MVHRTATFWRVGDENSTPFNYESERNGLSAGMERGGDGAVHAFNPEWLTHFTGSNENWKAYFLKTIIGVARAAEIARCAYNSTCHERRW